ncbi:MAG: carbamoyltransferase C-terminal domain-containing protein, partial [Campylobacterales bacterium]
FGPRALGHRSILADPTRDDAKELLNLKIKRREPFRPFAPSILKEFVDEYFVQSDSVPFMEKVFGFRDEKKEALKAVVHVDGSGRLQSVDREIEPKYYGLIERFYQKSGVPILLNTSFNENEPIVNTPEEAYNCFARTKMDMLVMGNIVVTR